MPPGTVIIPAHNEAAVIRRTLANLEPALAGGQVEVIVACNGCTDDTAAVARSVRGVRVIEVAEASKVAALNAADMAATRWPRIYLDADIELPSEALRATLTLLGSDGGVLCARPAFAYETQGASWLVRSYYRARTRMPQAYRSIWGAGVYGLSREGHARLGEFPPVTADDCYVDRLFSDAEKSILDCPPVIVRTPRSTRSLLMTLKRVYRGNAELTGTSGAHTGHSVRELIRTARGPASAVNALVYAVFAMAGRQASQQGTGWERDDSSRE